VTKGRFDVSWAALDLASFWLGVELVKGPVILRRSAQASFLVRVCPLPHLQDDGDLNENEMQGWGYTIFAFSVLEERV